MLLAAAARFPTLAQQSFWLDEAYTGHLVRMSFGGMLHAIPASESTPPIYYVLAWGWSHLFGYTEFGIRSLSALAGTLTVPVVYAVGARLANRRAGVIAGALVAVAPLMVWFSQEARSYALATLLSALTVLCFVSFWDSDDRRWLTAWAVSSALGVATHYFVGFVVVAELTWLLWRHHRNRQVVVACAFVLAIVLALVPLALAQRGTGHADYISHGGLGTRLLQVPKQLLVGYASPLQPLTAALAASLVLAAGLQAFVMYRARASERILIPLTVGLAGVLCPIALASVGIDFVNTRNLLPALPPLLVVAAMGFAARSSWPRGPVLALGLGVIYVVVLTLVDTHPRYQRDNWRDISRALGIPSRPRAVVVSPASGLLALQLYQPGIEPLNHAERVSELDVVAIPPRLTGAGIGPPARPRRALAVPPGFRLVRTYRGAYTVLRFEAQAPRVVTATDLAPSHFGIGSAAIATQAPP